MSSGAPGGRHAAAASRSALQVVAVVAVAVVVLGLLAWGAWGLTRGNGPDASAEGAPTTTATSAATADAHRSTTTPPASATSQPATSPASSSTRSADPQLAACRKQVAAGQQVVKDLVPIATHWREHTSAQTEYDEGKMSAKRAESIWDASKKPGPAEVARYDRAASDYRKKSGACGKVTSTGSDATACVKAAAAQTKIATAGAKVASDWATHIKDMKTKQTMSVEGKFDAYMAEWMKLVNRAPARLAAYDSAVKAARKAPTCS